jgi:hypothetical protein
MSQTPELSSDTIINGRRRVVVKFLDGRPEEIHVKLIPISKLAEFIDNIGSVPKVIAMATGKDEAWIDSLSPDSVFELDEIARTMNDPQIARWAARQRAAVTKTRGMMEELVAASKPSLPTA